MKDSCRTTGALLLTTLLCSACETTALDGAQAPGNTEWPHYARDLASSRYSPADQITAANVGLLEVAWRWTSPDEAIRKVSPALWTHTNQSTPIMAGGTLYTSTSMSQVAAIDPATGITRWVFDPESHKTGSTPNHYHHRGVAYWENGRDRRIFIATGDASLIALDANTGKEILAFGTKGRIDLTRGLRRPVDRLDYGVSSPPIVCADRVITGSTITDYPRNKIMPPGDIRGFDVRTGKQEWVFESVAQPASVGADTWEKESWRHTGNTNVWTMMSCDPQLGFVYLPFGTPSNDYYAADRPGNNLFAESLVALDARTGARKWHFQMVHHGVWDYDLPAAPNLIDITVNGRRIRAVVQVSKQGFTYVFDRLTGQPVWPIEEKAVPQAPAAQGEKLSPTQPFPTRPKAFDRQGVTVDDLIDFTPQLRAEATKMLKQYSYGPLFTPPSGRPTILLPGIGGGASWAGAAIDPGRGVMYVPSVTGPVSVRIVPAETADGYHKMMGAPGGVPGPRGLPMFKPPYGRITAIDLNTGEHLWVSPVGDGPRRHEAIRHLNLPPLGWARRTQVLLTPTLLFAAQQGTGTGEPRPGSPRGNADETTLRNADPALLAFDPRDGRQVAKVPIPGNATGAFITYVHEGVQYIVLPIGGASLPAEMIALRLPSKGR